MFYWLFKFFIIWYFIPLVLFCPYVFILFLLNINVWNNAFDSKNMLFLKSDSNPKQFSFFVFDFSVSNKISSTSTRLLNLQEFFNFHVYSNHPPPPRSLSFEEFSNPTPTPYPTPPPRLFQLPPIKHWRIVTCGNLRIQNYWYSNPIYGHNIYW